MNKIVFTLLGLASLALGYPDADKVDSLWQMPDLGNGMYSGYAPIEGTKKQLHYVAVLSQRDPLKDPIIVWFNGGPGCSSLYGLAAEHGPYVLEDGATNFTKNDYAWNKFANMIYIESPAGVGYSICGDASECIFDDDNSAKDNLAALLNVLQKFPEFNSNDLYLSGESYAGIYVPKLSEQLDKYIADNKGKQGVYIPSFKGFMVGNGVTDWEVDTTPAYIEMGYWFGLYEDSLYYNMKAKCDYSYFEFNYELLSPQCLEYY